MFMMMMMMMNPKNEIKTFQHLIYTECKVKEIVI